jgi:GNAT superfamily N-acetyltransferase
MISFVPISDVKLRVATSADLEIILHHRREMFREMGGEYRELLEEFENASRRYFQLALRTGTYYGLFAEVAGQIGAGGGVLIAPWPGSPLNFEPKRAWILNIYVEPHQRRKGLARIITQHLVDWCRDNGFQSVALHASEEGRKVYDKLGFRGTNEMRLVF